MRVGIILVVVAAVLLAPIGLLWAFQRRLIYLPAPRAVPPAASVLPTAEEVTFTTADGLRLGGWFVPAQPRPGTGGGSVENPAIRSRRGAVDDSATSSRRGAVDNRRPSFGGWATLQEGAPTAAAEGPARPGALGQPGGREQPGGLGQPGAPGQPGGLGQPGGPGRPGPAVLVCNGNGGNRSLRAALADALSRMGLHVLLFDYRGYGGNPGDPTEEGLAADARAAQAYLAGRAEVDADRLVYFGESLGAAVALRLAVERPPAALVLRSPFASLAEVGRRHYPLVPVSLLLRDRYESAALAGRLAAPLLVVAGGRDGIVPASHSRRLFAVAPQPKRLVVLEGADHNDHELLAGARLLAELRAFFAGVPGLLG
jgi:pimeloyl-ACP methyl ester carboxylesterase